MEIRQLENALTIRGLSAAEQGQLIEYLRHKYNFDYDAPQYPTWNDWSPKISLTAKAKDVPNQHLYTRSGCYKVWHNDTLIYIGETRCQKGNGGRPGMWARRSDFRSTILGEEIQNPYGNATRFVEEFGNGEAILAQTFHTFHYVHPLYCKQAEQDLLQEYYTLHGTLPILQHEKDYKRVK